MGPKYEFTDENMNYDGHILHRIKRLSDGKIGGWLESEYNLSQDGNCWVDDNAKVYGDAQVYGNAIVNGYANVYGDAQVYDNAQVAENAYVYGDAKVYGNAQVYNDAQVGRFAEVYDNAQVAGSAGVYSNARVYEDACVYGHAYICGNANVCGDAQACGDAYIDYNLYSEVVGDESTNESIDENSDTLKDFVYKIDDSSKLDVQTNYDSVDAFFKDTSVDSYVDHEYLTIIAVDTKVPILKLEKAQVKNKNIFKFIVDITNKDGDDYCVRAIIDSKEKFKQLLQSTINALNEYPQFNQYSDDLENCL